jgi:hypothetical protein
MPEPLTTITSAASEAAAVAVDAIATPTSAAASAGASLMPSPTMTTPPARRRPARLLLRGARRCGRVACVSAPPLPPLLSCCTWRSFSSGLQGRHIQERNEHIACLTL